MHDNRNYYVIVRGIVPGVYFDASNALENVCDIRDAHIRRFLTLATAVVGWRQALFDGHVTPLGDVTHTLLSRYFRYTLPTSLEHNSTQVEGLVGDNDISVSVGDEDEWRRAAYEHGPKWVVWKGRLPGILDTWYETCFRNVVH